MNTKLLIFLLLFSIHTFALAEGNRTYTLDQMASKIQKQTGAQILSGRYTTDKTGKDLPFQGKEERPCQGIADAA